MTLRKLTSLSNAERSDKVMSIDIFKIDTCMQTAWSRTGREHEYMLKEYLRGRDSCLAALIREGMRWTGRMCVLFWIG